jgi:hypothetical protein
MSCDATGSGSPIAPPVGCDQLKKLKSDVAGKSPKTVNNILCVLSTLLKAAVERSVISVMPAKVKLVRVSPSQVPFYEPYDYERLVEAAKSFADERLLVFVLLGATRDCVPERLLPWNRRM